MSFSVGVLYSAQEFAKYVAEHRLLATEFELSFERFALAKPGDILSVVQRCNWVHVHSDGICRITDKGRRIVDLPEDRALRNQIADLIGVEQPIWAVKLQHGRREAASAFPDDVSQCFEEAGLMGDWDDDKVFWWDNLALSIRSTRSALALTTGRTAEKLTIQYEAERTGVIPLWQSLESNFSGYDILSQVDVANSDPKQIEVKGTIISNNQAFFTVTRNEWNVAMKSPHYEFYLWNLKGAPILTRVTVDELRQHIPSDNAEGKWETARVFFKSFRR